MARSNRERTESTRRTLIEAGRRLFVERGFADTATPDIVEAAGVTRGALYHHFDDKRALFRAVVVEEAQKLAADIETGSSGESDPRRALLAGTRAYFDAMAIAGRTRLLLLDGPAVLGGQYVLDIDARNAQRSLRDGVSALLAPETTPGALDAFADLLSAAFDRAALAIEAGGQRKPYEAAIAALIDGIAVR